MIKDRQILSLLCIPFHHDRIIWRRVEESNLCYYIYTLEALASLLSTIKTNITSSHNTATYIKHSPPCIKLRFVTYC